MIVAEILVMMFICTELGGNEAVSEEKCISAGNISFESVYQICGGESFSRTAKCEQAVFDLDGRCLCFTGTSYKMFKFDKVFKPIDILCGPHTKENAGVCAVVHVDLHDYGLGFTLTDLFDRREILDKSCIEKINEQNERQEEKKRQDFLKKYGCRGGDILNWTDLININPFDVRGKCFDVQVYIFQVLGPHTALYALGGDEQWIVYIDFGQKSAPIDKRHVISFIAKGTGAFQYRTAFGGVNTVPKLKWIAGSTE